jgi:hypothetical protein
MADLFSALADLFSALADRSRYPELSQQYRKLAMAYGSLAKTKERLAPLWIQQKIRELQQCGGQSCVKNSPLSIGGTALTKPWRSRTA